MTNQLQMENQKQHKTPLSDRIANATVILFVTFFILTCFLGILPVPHVYARTSAILALCCVGLFLYLAHSKPAFIPYTG